MARYFQRRACDCGAELEEYAGFLYCPACYWCDALGEEQEAAVIKRRNRNRRQEIRDGIKATVLIETLQAHSKVIATQNGHTLTAWVSAKKALGKGATKAMCSRCRQDVAVMPYGSTQVAGKAHRDLPTIQGQVAFGKCVSQIPPRPAPKQGELIGER